MESVRRTKLLLREEEAVFSCSYAGRRVNGETHALVGAASAKVEVVVSESSLLSEPPGQKVMVYPLSLA